MLSLQNEKTVKYHHNDSDTTIRILVSRRQSQPCRLKFLQSSSLRKPTKVSPEKPIELAAEIRRFRALVREAVKTGNVKKSRFANIDETAVQVFALMVRAWETETHFRSKT